MAFLGGLSVAGLAGTALFGALGLLLTVPAITAYGIVRHRRRSCSTTSIAPVAVDAPRRRVSSA